MENFSSTIIQFLIAVPTSTQYFVLFLFSFAEGMPIIGSILPGGTIAIFAGTLVQQGLLSPVLTSLVIGLSSFLGDMTGFLIGKKFKHLRFIRSIVENEKHQKTWDLFDRHLMLISIFGKLIPVVRSSPSILAAVRGVKTRRYIFYSFIGSILWAIVGVYAGKLLENFLGEKAIPIIFAVIVISMGAVGIRMVIKKLIKRHKRNKENSTLSE